MRGTVLYGPGDVRFEERPDPRIIEPADAIIRLAATCVCGSDLGPYRGMDKLKQPVPMGHEYCGSVEEVGKALCSHTGLWHGDQAAATRGFRRRQQPSDVTGGSFCDD